ncbi:hypothetical protein TRICI_004762 [Trichomonascus ciferrii]|uniref:Uncharacterized protein n=1 Tax=Trichomonascus ciferrii TaxID=44093 RepID=A0A642UZ73_9ASCO|nr:hypothetical protein TRICI_004762 [Trichomonascus ciferrii]
MIHHPSISQISHITSSTIVLGESAAVPRSATSPTPATQQSLDLFNHNNNNSNNSNMSESDKDEQQHTVPYDSVITDEPPERCTSPRRDNSAIERIGREKVHVLRKEAQLMQDSLSDILDRIVQVKQDYDRLSSENKFLQDYIGNLMATSNILNKSSH